MALSSPCAVLAEAWSKLSFLVLALLSESEEELLALRREDFLDLVRGVA